jgi:hypothetical protein
MFQFLVADTLPEVFRGARAQQGESRTIFLQREHVQAYCLQEKSLDRESLECGENLLLTRAKTQEPCLVFFLLRVSF